VDPSGNVYVADTGNNRVQKFGSVATISVDQTVLIIVIALIVGSVGAYLTMRKLPKKLWNRS
jgi:DNA-binding beta-propeller fold protein YncE